MSLSSAASKDSSTPPLSTRSLNDLPAEVIDGIVGRLPILDAVRASVVSRTWRRRWLSVPELTFSITDTNLDIDIAAVDHVLRLHSGPIHSFSIFVSLSHHYYFSHHHVSRWLAALSTIPDPPLRSLTIHFHDHHDGRSRVSVTVDSTLFSFSNLTHIHLRRCWLRNRFPPRFFLGFPVLETLDLVDCSFWDAGRLSELVSNCPLLQDLNLMDVEVKGGEDLRICSPNLRSLVFVGSCPGFVIADAPLLKTASIGLKDIVESDDDDDEDDDDDDEKYDLIRAFGRLHSIEKLDLFEDTLHFLRKFRTPKTIPGGFEGLKLLSLAVDFDKVDEILVLLCLLRSSPNLQELEIIDSDYQQVSSTLGHGFWEKQDQLDLSKLRTLKLTNFTCGITGARPTLECIDFILPNAQGLEKMLIYFAGVCSEWRRGRCELKFKELMKHWRDSTRAEIIYTVLLYQSREIQQLHEQLQEKLRKLYEDHEAYWRENEAWKQQMSAKLAQLTQLTQQFTPSQLPSTQSPWPQPAHGSYYPPPKQGLYYPPPPQGSYYQLPPHSQLGPYQMYMTQEQWNDYNRYLASRNRPEGDGAGGGQ